MARRTAQPLCRGIGIKAAQRAVEMQVGGMEKSEIGHTPMIEPKSDGGNTAPDKETFLCDWGKEMVLNYAGWPVGKPIRNRWGDWGSPPVLRWLLLSG